MRCSGQEPGTTGERIWRQSWGGGMMISGDICPPLANQRPVLVTTDQWEGETLWHRRVIWPRGELARPRLHTGIRTETGTRKNDSFDPATYFRELALFASVKRWAKQPPDILALQLYFCVGLNRSSLKLSYELMSKTYCGPNPKRFIITSSHSKVCLDHSRKQFILIKLQSLAR